MKQAKRGITTEKRTRQAYKGGVEGRNIDTNLKMVTTTIGKKK